MLGALSVKWVEFSPSYLAFFGRSSIIPFTLCVWAPRKYFDIISCQFNIDRAYSIPFHHCGMKVAFSFIQVSVFLEQENKVFSFVPLYPGKRLPHPLNTVA